MTSSSRWRTALASAASAAVLVAAPLAGAQTAHAAAPYPPPASCLTLSATTVRMGDDVHFTGTGFVPHQRVLVSLDWRALRLRRADGGGTVDGDVHIPWAHRGMHMFRLTAWRGPHHTCSAQIQVIGGAYPPVGGAPGGGGGSTGGWGWEDGRGRHTHLSSGEHGLTTTSGDHSLAKTGDEKALTYGGAAAGMIAAGGGMLLAMRRRRSS